MPPLIDPPAVDIGNYLGPRVPHVQARLIHRPLATLDEVRAWVQHVTRSDRLGEARLRAAGMRHSWRSAWEVNGFLINSPDADHAVIIDDHSQLRAEVRGRHFARARAGAQMRPVNDALASKNLALPVMGNFNGLTLVGACAAGTHGTSMGPPGTPVPHGPMASLVRSIELVDKHANVFRIEPARDPITDPARFDQPGVTLVQDNGVFDAAVLHLGAMGIVWEITVEVQPAFWLREVRRSRPWSVVRASLLAGTPDLPPGADAGSLHGWTVVACPYADAAGDHLCVETVWLRCTAQQANALPRSAGCLLNLLGDFLRLTQFDGTWRTNPGLIPDDIRNGLAQMATYAPHEVADRSHLIMSTDFSGHPPPGTATELALPYATPAERGRLVAAVDALFARVGEMTLEAPRRYLGGYFALRFVGRFTALLATTFDGDRCTIEMPTLITPAYDSVLDELERLLIAEYGGRPHWALHNTLYNNGQAATLVRQLYGDRADAWRLVRNRFDPSGTPALHPDPLFDNPYIAGMGLV